MGRPDPLKTNGQYNKRAASLKALSSDTKGGRYSTGSNLLEGHFSLQIDSIADTGTRLRPFPTATLADSFGDQ